MGGVRARTRGRLGTAFFLEFSFPSGGPFPLKTTTGVRVLPDALPYPAPEPKRPTGRAPS